MLHLLSLLEKLPCLFAQLVIWKLGPVIQPDAFVTVQLEGFWMPTHQVMSMLMLSMGAITRNGMLR